MDDYALPDPELFVRHLTEWDDWPSEAHSVSGEYGATIGSTPLCTGRTTMEGQFADESPIGPVDGHLPGIGDEGTHSRAQLNPRPSHTLVGDRCGVLAVTITAKLKIRKRYKATRGWSTTTLENHIDVPKGTRSHTSITQGTYLLRSSSPPSEPPGSDQLSLLREELITLRDIIDRKLVAIDATMGGTGTMEGTSSRDVAPSSGGTFPPYRADKRERLKPTVPPPPHKRRRGDRSE